MKVTSTNLCMSVTLYSGVQHLCGRRYHRRGINNYRFVLCCRLILYKLKNLCAAKQSRKRILFCITK